MLSHEIMGALCLLSLWTAAVLVALAAFQDALDLLRLWSRARRAVRGVIASGTATWRIQQRGRALDSKVDAIAFHDRAFEGELRDVTVEAAGQTYAIENGAQIWPSDQARRAAAACSDVSLFERAYGEAVRAAGYLREVKVDFQKGDAVFVLGEPNGGAFTSSRGPVVVAAFDPRGYLLRRVTLLLAFIPLELFVCLVVTRVAMTAPHFGAVSTVGAILGIAFFLGVTPVGVSLREWARRPNDAYLRGEWRRGRGAPRPFV